MPDLGVVESFSAGESGNVINERKEHAKMLLSFTFCAHNEDKVEDLAEQALKFFKHTGYDYLSSHGYVVIEVTNFGSRTLFEIDDYQRRYGFDVAIRYAQLSKRDDERIIIQNS
jgi:hypothetical protein